MKNVWTVDEYCDRITARTERAVGKDDAWRRQWGYKKFMPRFGSEKEAIEFIISRAETAVRDAEKLVLTSRKKLAKLKKRFTQDTPEPQGVGTQRAISQREGL